MCKLTKNLFRQLRAMTPKRKRTISKDYDDEAGPSAHFSTCNFCLRVKPLLSVRRYCASCAHNRVECRSCHHPLDEHPMDDNGRCHACNAKPQKQSSVMGAANIIDIFHHRTSATVTHFFSHRRVENRRVLRCKIFFCNLKAYLLMIFKMIKYNLKGEEIVMDVVFHSELETIFLLSDFDLQFDRMVGVILQKIKDFVKLESGWSILSVERLELHIAPYLPISASSFVATLTYIAQKKAVVNIQNEDRQHHINFLLSTAKRVSATIL